MRLMIVAVIFALPVAAQTESVAPKDEESAIERVLDGLAPGNRPLAQIVRAYQHGEDVRYEVLTEAPKVNCIALGFEGEVIAVDKSYSAPRMGYGEFLNLSVEEVHQIECVEEF